MSLMTLRADAKNNNALAKKNKKTNTPINNETITQIIKKDENIPEGPQEPLTVLNQESNKKEGLNSEKKALLEQPSIAVELRSIQENVSSNGEIPVRKKGEKKRNDSSAIKVTHITEKQFNSFDTFIPNKGNIPGNKLNKNSAVQLSEENEKFVAMMIYKYSSRKYAVVNHMMDIVRTYFKDSIVN